jgi:phosphoserine aminotransferase
MAGDTVGGLDAMGKINADKAAILYEAIDGCDGFYRGVAEPGRRSRMNVTFRLPSEEQESAFVERAAAEGMSDLGGHRSVGGIRASIYNAMPVKGVAALRDLMERFRASS